MKKLSLQDQLLKAGLTNKSNANKIKSQKHKQAKQQQNKKPIVNEVKQQADAARAKQLEKDRLLNEQRNKAAEQKQIAGQIRQLIELNKLQQDEEGAAFNFTDDNKVKALYLSEALKNDVIAGRAVIARTAQQYQVVAANVAAKIAERDESCLIILADAAPVSDDYADFEVPDDLMW